MQMLTKAMPQVNGGGSLTMFTRQIYSSTNVF